MGGASQQRARGASRRRRGGPGRRGGGGPAPRAGPPAPFLASGSRRVATARSHGQGHVAPWRGGRSRESRPGSFGPRGSWWPHSRHPSATDGRPLGLIQPAAPKRASSLPRPEPRDGAPGWPPQWGADPGEGHACPCAGSRAGRRASRRRGCARSRGPRADPHPWAPVKRHSGPHERAGEDWCWGWALGRAGSAEGRTQPHAEQAASNGTRTLHHEQCQESNCAPLASKLSRKSKRDGFHPANLTPKDQESFTEPS